MRSTKVNLQFLLHRRQTRCLHHYVQYNDVHINESPYGKNEEAIKT